MSETSSTFRHLAFVLKLGEDYCKFESYSEVRLVQNPLRASLYANIHNAQYRRTGTLRGDEGDVDAALLEIVQIEVAVVKETVIESLQSSPRHMPMIDR